MLIVLSPAKRLDWSETGLQTTEPVFPRDAARLAGHARQLTLGDLKALMGLSDDLARLNRDRFRAFTPDPDPETTRPAILAFAGDTYVGLDARSLDSEALDWAQDHLRILSGLYGLLRPRDAIQPYRLEMGSRLKTRRGTSLYDFWGDRIATALNEAAGAIGTDVILNCASQEYFGAVDRKRLTVRVLTPAFLEDRDGEGRTIGLFAKRARGAMARFVIDRRITSPEGLKEFDTMGYRFDPVASTPDTPVFRRPYGAEEALKEAS
ncbi:peroxide stress protein YaaA [Palleronia sp. KMU-117]|uniref:peroxide stress protein YaaA n=1 Tax=Palleronia sp. KMU-117 TaxID=3434108 RepID=UPI003D739259